MPSATQVVEYPAPSVSDGAAPVTTTCSPASGSAFSLGSTPVVCVASDAQTRQSSCSFNVSLTGLALSATRFNTFGDSITEGEMGRPNIAPTLLDPPNAYPTKLQAAFNETYPNQGIVVVNRGLSGDSVEATEAKLRQFLPVDRPEVVLLLTGYNNLTGSCSPGRGGTSECGNAIDKVAIGLRDCLRRVKEANVGVRYTFLSTLTPPGPTGSNRIDGGAILQTNGRIRQLVTDGVVLVDAHAAFVGREAEYVNVDGLHLRPAGNQALADTFFAAIKATVPQTPLLSVR